MHKILITFMLILFSRCLLLGDVGVMSITDEDKHSKKEDFYHTFEYFVIEEGADASQQVGKCQATRISNRWFVTAAHCVQEKCKNGCAIQLDLLETSPSALASFTHTPKKPLVFVHPDYSPHVFAKNDFALLRLDLSRVQLTYYRRPTKTQNFRQLISDQEFTRFLDRNLRAKSALNHALRPKFPPILYFDEGNFVLDRKISVIAIFDGLRDVKQDPNPVYYVKDLGFAHTKNFGIRKGMSGSGVMSNTGELIGMVAGNFETWYKKGNGPYKTEDYFMFPVFNKGLVDFMKDKMGSDFDKLYLKEANPYCVYKTSNDFSMLIRMVKQADKRAAASSKAAPSTRKK